MLSTSQKERKPSAQVKCIPHLSNAVPIGILIIIKLRINDISRWKRNWINATGRFFRPTNIFVSSCLLEPALTQWALLMLMLTAKWWIALLRNPFLADLSTYILYSQQNPLSWGSQKTTKQKKSSYCNLGCYTKQ